MSGNFRPLGYVADFLNGFAFKPEDWEEDGLPIIRIQNLTGNGSTFNYTNRVVPSKYRVQAGTLLVSWSASLGVFKWAGPEALVNQHIFKVEPKLERVDLEYLRHAIDASIHEMERFTHGSTMKHINRREFLDHHIPLPPLDEQRRIAAILDKAGILRQKRKRALKLLEGLTQSVFLEMFGDPVENPKNLPVAKLGDVGTLDRGISKHRPRNDPALLGGSHPFIQTGDVSNSGGYIRAFGNTYSDKGLAQSKMWPKGTLCITIAANIAQTGILTFDACFPDSVVGYTHPDPSMVQYVRVWLTFLQSTLEQSAQASAQKNINLQILRGLNICTPDASSLARFGRVLKAQLDQERRLRSADVSWEAAFTSLQHRAFAGQL